MTRIQRLAAGGGVLSIALALSTAAFGQDAGLIDTQFTLEQPTQQQRAVADSSRTDVIASGSALGERLGATGDAERFYDMRNGEAAWISRGRLTGEALDLIGALQDADAQGLDPAAYHLSALAGVVDRRGLVRQDAEAEADVLLTDAFMTYADQMLNGRVDPSVQSSDTEVNGEARDFAGMLAAALDRRDVKGTLESLAPVNAQYAMLQRAYERYSEAAKSNPWPTVDDGETLKVGMRDPRVAQIRARLDAEDEFDGRDARGSTDSPFGVIAATDNHGLDAAFAAAGIDEPADAPSAGAMIAAEADPTLYDEALAARVEAFQARHGLQTDGAVGPNTLAMLNQGLAERARAIEMNMERWRWLPNDMGDKYLLVNAPQYELHGYDHGRETLTMDVIVGQPGHATPQFSDEMEYVVANPRWHITYNIATNETIHKIRNDVGYLAANNMAVYRDGQRIDPYSVNWSNYGRGNFPFQIVQLPGDDNALGRIKFIFPNSHDVYLHDTDNHSLFAKDMRALSHGCVRLSDPMGLARWLSDEDTGLEYSAVEAQIASGATKQMNLDTHMPVHLTYFTAWANDDGTVDFYGDIYGRDAALGAAMYDAS